LKAWFVIRLAADRKKWGRHAIIAGSPSNRAETAPALHSETAARPVPPIWPVPIDDPSVGLLLDRIGRHDALKSVGSALPMSG
jgi:hypothetical protein